MAKIFEIKFFGLFFTLAMISSVLGEYVYDGNDFADEVIEYVAGVGLPLDIFTNEPFDDASMALGEPTVDTTGDLNSGSPFEMMPVVPTYPAFRRGEVVSVGAGGTLTVKFRYPVEDNKGNPYGLDFIIFGNSYCVMDGSSYWHKDDDPETVYIMGNHVHQESGVVSVSQDGMEWFIYCNNANDPNALDDPNHTYADDFAPTLGRVYDINEPEESLFTGNLYWGHPTDPTFPMDPNLSVGDFSGKSMGAICRNYYGESAGGRGFDISKFDLEYNERGVKWIQYVRVHNPRVSGATPELDAVSDVRGAGDRKQRFFAGDVNRDGKVGEADLLTLGEYWLCEEIAEGEDVWYCDCRRDGIVDLGDFSVLAEDWQKEGYETQ